jgi:hypothetical protein
MDFIIWIIGLVITFGVLGLIWLYIKAISNLFKIVALLLIIGILGGGGYYLFKGF